MKIYKKYLLSAFVLFTVFVATAPQTTSAFWPFDYFKQNNVQKSENLTGAAVKSEPEITICQMLDLFISLGIIPPDKVEQARVAVSPWCPSGSSSSSSSSSSASSTPSISDINPKSGAVGSKVNLWGRGFIENSRISFGGGRIEGAFFYPCNDGNTKIDCVDFKVPDRINRECYYQTPKCLAPTILIKPGKYPVSVYNSNGVSNVVSFQVVSLSPHAEYSVASTSIGGNAGVVGVASSSLTAIITLKARAIGGSMIKPVAGDFTFVFASTTQINGAYTSANSVAVVPLIQVSPTDSSIGDGRDYTITLTGLIYSNNTSIGSSQALFGAIKDIDSSVGGVNVVNQTWGIDTFHTAPATLTKGGF